MAKKITSIEDYRENFIDYYNQYLGLPSLSETGIEVEETDVEEDIALAPPGEETDDELNIFSGSIVAGEGSEREISFGLPSISPYSSYKDALKAAGLQDRTPFFNNIIDPLVGGTAKDVEVLEQVGARVDVTTPKKESIKKGIAKVADAAVSAIVGRPVTNGFGKPSFRLSGSVGAISDLLHATQYKGIQEIQSAQAVNAADQGFAMTLGNYGIIRRPGSGAYTGNTRGLSYDHIKSLEAVSKGFVPSTYSFDGKPSKYLPDFLKPQVNVSIEGSGGSFVDPSNRMGGFYTADGKFYDPKTNTTSAYGLESSRDTLAKTNGITPAQANLALGIARRGEMTLADAISSIKGDSGDDTYTSPTSPEEKGMGAGAPSVGDTYVPPEAALGAGAGDENFGGESTKDGAAGEATGGAGDQREGSGWGGMARGGRVGLQMGGAARMASGFVDRPPEQVPEGQTVADNVDTQLPEGAFVINAAAVEFAGSNDVKKMLLDAHKEAIRRGITVDKQGNGAKMIDVAISRGEVVVAPHLAKIIGYDRLNKINNRGKRETSERIQENGQQQQGAAMGMLISGQTRPFIAPEVTMQEQGFIEQEPFDPGPLPSPEEDVFFGHTIGELKKAIRGVEIKGYEKNPYIFTGIRRKGGASSAFGPMQITASTLRDMKERSPYYRFLADEEKEYIDSLIQQGDDKVNVEKYGSIYRDKKARPTSKEMKKKLGRLGEGVIPRELHEQHYDVVADLVLRQKLADHDTLKDALASYGEGESYANKVMKGLN